MSTKRTSLTPEGLALLRGRVADLVGQPWSIVQLSYGGEVRAGLGALVPAPRGGKSGAWELGTRGSPWQLAVGGKPVASERDEERTWVGALDVLKGQVVSRVAIAVPGPDLLIEFESGDSFSVLPSKQPEWVAWELFCPDGSVIITNCDGSWVEGRRDEVDEQ